MEENDTPYVEENQANNEPQTDHAFPEDDFHLDLDELTNIERLSMENIEAPVAPAPPRERTALTSRKTVNKPIVNSARNTTSNYLNRENGSDTQSNSQKENFPVGDYGFDDIDFDEEMDENTLRKYNGTKEASTPSTVEVGNKFDSQIQHGARTIVVSPQKASPTLSAGKRSSVI